MCLFDQKKFETIKSKDPKCDHEDTIFEYLRDIMKENHSLVHLSLNNTGLSTHILFELMTFIKASPTLASVHLSNNPGVTEESIEQFAQVLEIDLKKVREAELKCEH